jgi:hypothetical protein
MNGPVLELRLRDLSQLFDSLDPSPFLEKDLDPKAEEYILDSVAELPPQASYSLLIHLDRAASHPDPDHDVGKAIREHFARQSKRLRRKLRRLIRRGLLSLAIGVAFLAAAFAVTQGIRRLLGETGALRLLEQGLLIVGWVAMWRPLEIFLYDWWPILGEQRLFDRLSRIDVRVVEDPAPGSEAIPGRGLPATGRPG